MAQCQCFGLLKGSAQPIRLCQVAPVLSLPPLHELRYRHPLTLGVICQKVLGCFCGVATVPKQSAAQLQLPLVDANARWLKALLRRLSGGKGELMSDKAMDFFVESVGLIRTEPAGIRRGVV